MAIKRLTGTGIQSRNGKTSKVWDQESSMGAFESIATAIVDASGASSITFSNIPQQYKHLQIRAVSRGTISGYEDNIYIQFNGDTGTNYSWHVLGGNGSSTYANGYSSTWHYAYAFHCSGQSSLSNNFGAGVLDILDYTNINKNKTLKALNGLENNGNGSPAGWAELSSGLYFGGTIGNASNTITSISLFCPTYNIAQYSHFALYGIRG